MSTVSHPIRAGGALEAALRARRASGGASLVPYLTGGCGRDWLDAVRAVAAAGADAIEVGIPFSDPVMDGPTIQEASVRALAEGTTPQGLLGALRGADVGVPLIVMTYFNPVLRMGCERFAQELSASGVSGAIIPDLPIDEAGEWLEAADSAGVETVLLAAPTTPAERLERICGRTRGFLYAVGLLGVTGERSALSTTATLVAERAKAVTDKPVLVGVGVSTPEQAVEVVTIADGVVVGSALVRRVLDGAGPDGVAATVTAFRAALDAQAT